MYERFEEIDTITEELENESEETDPEIKTLEDGLHAYLAPIRRQYFSWKCRSKYIRPLTSVEVL